MLNCDETRNARRMTDRRIDVFLGKAKTWGAELARLRMILLDCGLTETFKWRSPCYAFEGHNVAIMGELKDCCTLGFFKGALLKDADSILDKPGPNTQSARVIRFTSLAQIAAMESTLKTYVKEAVAVEKAGLKVDFKEKTDLVFAPELLTCFQENAAFKEAFQALTPGRQRAYNMHFNAAKQSKTRVARIEKSFPRILDGIGLNDWQ